MSKLMSARVVCCLRAHHRVIGARLVNLLRGYGFEQISVRVSVTRNGGYALF